jgi:hypothetical protein
MGSSNRQARLAPVSDARGIDGAREFRCIRLQTCNSGASWMSSSDGARLSKMTGRRPRLGGGGRPLKTSACGNRCRPSGAPVWNCLLAPVTRTVPGFFSGRLPARHRCPGRTIFRAEPGIQMPLRSAAQYRNIQMALFSLDRPVVLRGLALASGCSGGDASSSGGDRSNSANCCGGTGLLNRNPCISSQA